MTQQVPSTSPSIQYPAAIVIGGANVDNKSQTLARPVSGTSNPGRSRSSLGGVGRNVAENLARLGVSTALITAIGEDANGDRLLHDTEAAGVDLRHSVRTLRPTGTYTALLDETGEMIIAISAMEAIDDLTADVIEAHRTLIAQAHILVLDCNVPADALVHAATIARDNAVRVVVDPVSVVKANRILSILDAGLPLHSITPNLDEFRALSGAIGLAGADIESAATQLHAAGVQHVWVRLGEGGSFLSATQEGTQHCEHIGACPATVVDRIGAGDAMLAGYVVALLRGRDPFSAAKYGRAAAAITVESEDTVSPFTDFATLAARVAKCNESAS